MDKHQARFNTSKIVEIDGRHLEGGGQLVRNAVCLSALTGIPIRIQNIRGNRPKGGGLKAQHLACVNWLAHASRARLEGAEIGSRTLIFEPGKEKADAQYEISPVFTKVKEDGKPVYQCRPVDIGTAGSTTLAVQAILPFILFSGLPSGIPIKITLTGGTNVSQSPSFEYMTEVLFPMLEKIGLPRIKATLKKRGWSIGNSSPGEIVLEIPPRDSVILPAFCLRPHGLGMSSSPDSDPETDEEKEDEEDEEVEEKAAGKSAEQPSEPQEAETSTYFDPSELFPDLFADPPAKPVHVRATLFGPAQYHKDFNKVVTSRVNRLFRTNDFSIENENLTIICENSQHDKRMYFLVVATLSTSDSTSKTEPASAEYFMGRDALYENKKYPQSAAMTAMVEKACTELAAMIASKGWVDEKMMDQLKIYQALAQGKSEVFVGRKRAGPLVQPSLHAKTAEWIAKMLLGVEFDAWGNCEGVGFGKESASATEGLEKSMGKLNITSSSSK